VGGQRLADKFGEERYAAMRGHLQRFAAGFGLTGMHSPDRSPNTRAALALAEHARDEGRLHEARHALMDAFWRRGEDLEDREVLARCATAAGLDPARALAAITDPVITARVDAMGREAARAGVTGIPTFVIGDRRVVGCQPYEVLAAAARAAGAQPR
jgi:predicted DsbA family dithiol-disulfide isomerase